MLALLRCYGRRFFSFEVHGDSLVFFFFFLFILFHFVLLMSILFLDHEALHLTLNDLWVSDDYLTGHSRVLLHFSLFLICHVVDIV